MLHGYNILFLLYPPYSLIMCVLFAALATAAFFAAKAWAKPAAEELGPRHTRACVWTVVLSAINTFLITLGCALLVYSVPWLNNVASEFYIFADCWLETVAAYTLWAVLHFVSQFAFLPLMRTGAGEGYAGTDRITKRFMLINTLFVLALQIAMMIVFG